MRSAPRELVWEVVEGEAMIVDVTTGDYFSLNRVATEIWTGLQSNQSADTIVDTMANRYGVAHTEVAEDVEELLGQLAEMGLWNA
jgi:hypothetical protein